MEHYRGWLTLHLLPEIGRGLFNRLLRHFGNPDAALSASRAELETVPGVGPLAAGAILNRRELVDPDEELRRIEKAGAHLVCLRDEDYPANLRRTSAPPPLLYVRGTLTAMDEAAVAVIGSRKMSRYGQEATREIAGGLARAGITIVSGLAIGTDGFAHRTALDAGARTLAVLGNGLGSVYPAQHRKLAEEIVENGALISEMPMAATPDPGSFPARNAIIAGLSLGVAVIEAGAKSGTFITAAHALEENRSVFAVPGDITRANSLGANRLIQEGAKLIASARDVLEDLRPQLVHLLEGLPPLPELDETPPAPKDLTETERRVYESLELDPLSIDDLMEVLAAASDDAMEEPSLVAPSARTEEELIEAGTGAQSSPTFSGGPALSDAPLSSVAPISPGEVMAALLNLEIRGLIRQEAGMTFRKTRKRPA